MTTEFHFHISVWIWCKKSNALFSPTKCKKTDREELKQVEQKINDLLSSEEYKTLQKRYRRNKKNAAGNGDDENEDWIAMQEQLTELKKKEQNWFDVIKSSSASSVKKVDSVRKGYKKETATKSQRALLTSIANELRSTYGFKTKFDDPTFGDVMYATGFKSHTAIYEYFQSKKQAKEVENGGLKDHFTQKQWDYLVDLNYRVNGDLHSNLRKERGGITVVVLEADVYDPDLVTDIAVRAGVVQDADHLDVKNAESDSTDHSGSSKGGSPTDKKVTS